MCACGPVEYIGQVSNRAQVALVQAHRVQADKYAPYEYTKAREYLQKAREKAGRASFQAAIEYGRRSEEMAGRARAIAVEHERQAVAGPVLGGQR